MMSVRLRFFGIRRDAVGAKARRVWDPARLLRRFGGRRYDAKFAAFSPAMRPNV